MNRSQQRTSSTPGMRFRQIFVTVCAALCLVGFLLGSGILGTSVEESGGGELSADATLIAPAGPAFSVWTVIYVGLAAYTVRQWMTRNADTPRHRATAMLAGVSMLLNAAWLLVTQQGWIWVSVLVIVGLLLTCALIVLRLHAHPQPGTVEKIVVDGTFGLYLGWVCVAICANIAAAIVGTGVSATGTWQTAVTVLVLAVVVVVAGRLSAELRGNWFVSAGIMWGLAWIAIGRFGDEPQSPVVGVAAIAAAVAVAVLTWCGNASKPNAQASIA